MKDRLPNMWLMDIALNKTFIFEISNSFDDLVVIVLKESILRLTDISNL